MVLLINTSVVFICFGAAIGVRFANGKANSIQRIVIERPAPTLPPAVASTLVVNGPSGDPAASSTTGAPAAGAPVNFLVVGSDSRACVDPNSADAGQLLGLGDGGGNQSDTIMVLRVEPATGQAAILSFPRDLFVKLAGSNRSAKINAAFSGGNASRLIQTIEQNFGVPIDHYVQIDFCAFKSIVDAVGGVKIYFEYPTRDTHSGLYVPEASCVSFDGIGALRYARSRYYEWSTNGGTSWQNDGTSDRGRIRRQQDFIKRVMRKAIDKGARRPQVAAKLLDATLKYVQFDSELRVDALLDLAAQFRTFDPASVRTFRIDGVDQMVGDQSVIRPLLNNAGTKQVLAIFRGEQSLAEATAPTAPLDDASATTVAALGAASTVLPGEDSVGYLPPDNPACR